MPSINPYIIGLPGQRAPQTASPRIVFFSADRSWLPGGRFIDGTKSRDTNNTPEIDRLQAGLLMGKVTASGYYANWSIDQLTVNYTSGTSMTISAAGATELVRRVGSTGTFVVTGPPVTGYTTRQTTVTYSAVNTSTGVITMTAPTGANEVQQISFNGASTATGLVLTVPKPDGTTVNTAAITWSATPATYITNINNAIDTALGSVGLWVASGAAPSSDITLTAASTYANQAIPTLFAVATLPAGSLSAAVVEVTRGVPIAFLAGSVISQNDGSQTPVTFLPDGFPMEVTDSAGSVAQIEFPHFPIGGIIDPSTFIGWSAMDASLQTYVKNQLSSILGGKYVFKDAF